MIFNVNYALKLNIYTLWKCFKRFIYFKCTLKNLSTTLHTKFNYLTVT